MVSVPVYAPGQLSADWQTPSAFLSHPGPCMVKYIGAWLRRVHKHHRSATGVNQTHRSWSPRPSCNNE